MKFIFDFDDVLFDTKKLKENIFRCLGEISISKNTEEKYYEEFKSMGTPFSLKEFLSSLLTRENKKKDTTEDIYEKIMSLSLNLANTELLKIIKKLGKKNCYIVTSGDEEFQLDKIRRSNIDDYFCEILVAPHSKKGIIEKICKENKGEQIIFVDDKIKFFEDLDMTKCPNLKTILFDENGFEKLSSVL
ncbi:MAG: HAD hydrolase-like protein [Candidatus Nomurabacteria bacterium]|nr:HAD hydrolase-like protein [Candidatus Nomurabacteria bacterium]